MPVSHHLTPTGDFPTMTPRSAQVLLTMATNRAPLDFRIFPASFASRLSGSVGYLKDGVRQPLLEGRVFAKLLVELGVI